MANSNGKVTGLTLITPDSEDFDSGIGRKGRPDVVSPVMNELLTQALEAGLDSFQVPNEAEFTDEAGKTHKLTIGKVRTWAHDKDKLPKFGILPDGKKLMVAGGVNGQNIALTLHDVKTEANA